MADVERSDEALVFNGINGESGEYGLPPMSGEELATFVQGEGTPENLDELRFRYRQSVTHPLGVRHGVDVRDLAQTGWAVLFAHDADPEIRAALQPLLDLRREQAGDLFQLYEGGDGYREGESKDKWLGRHGAGPGPAVPEKVPYYILIVGSPEKIPYRFQSQLDVQYAVGRIDFETAEEYARYAASVVASEQEKFHLPRRMTFFGVANEDDKATQLSTKELVEPLAGKFRNRFADWEVESVLREEATKSALADLLGGQRTPALLFTASHGMEFPKGSERQIPHQGALLCQDWPGPVAGQGKKVPQDFYFAGDDLAADDNLAGLIAFFFACYGGGTPLLDEFAKEAFKDRMAIAPRPFTSRLPMAMLSRPKGSALAVVGHVERAWGYSFLWPGAGAQTEVFESSLRRLLAGYPIGAAVEYFNERYAELATMLSDALEEAEFEGVDNPYQLSGMWTANNDARGYTIIGDPAVRLRVAPAGEAVAVERPEISVQGPSEMGGQATGPEAGDATAEDETEASAEGEAAGEGQAESVSLTVTAGALAESLEVVTRNEDGTGTIRSVIAADGTAETIVSGDGLALLPLHEVALRQAIAMRLAAVAAQQSQTTEK